MMGWGTRSILQVPNQDLEKAWAAAHVQSPAKSEKVVAAQRLHDSIGTSLPRLTVSSFVKFGAYNLELRRSRSLGVPTFKITYRSQYIPGLYTSCHSIAVTSCLAASFCPIRIRYNISVKDKVGNGPKSRCAQHNTTAEPTQLPCLVAELPRAKPLQYSLHPEPIETQHEE